MKTDDESATLLEETLADEADFATEHCDLTVGDQERGGPEGLPEPESPKGYGGADIHRSRRPREHRTQVIMALSEPHTETFKPEPEPNADVPTEPEPDFALEHRHLTAGGPNHPRTRRH